MKGCLSDPIRLIVLLVLILNTSLRLDLSQNLFNETKRIEVKGVEICSLTSLKWRVFILLIHFIMCTLSIVSRTVYLL